MVRRTPSRLSSLIVGAAVMAGGAVVSTAPAAADTAPASPATTPTVAADALPAPQIDGVVWAQAVVGTTVYAVGEFTTARPAGAAPGVSTVPRSNILAYDIETGLLDPDFDPVLNAQAVSIAASPDGSRVYVTGDFTQVDGELHVRVAAFDTATQQVVTAFNPTLASGGLSVAATSDTVYVGGNFTSVAATTGGTLEPRSYLAAFDAATGAVKPFRADGNAPVTALAVTADRAKVVVGGRFTTFNGVAATGLAAVDPTSGASVSFPATQQIKNSGTSSTITSLFADETGVYGTGYHFGRTGNLEGSFRADPTTGALIWVADCHGDTYSSFRQGAVLYAVGHSHYCGNLPGGYPQTEPWSYHHLSAFTLEATGINTPDIYGYPDHDGEPSPTALHLNPQFYTGTYTGQGQAGWSVAGNDEYVVMGGEFTGLNGQAQQGLVRFATTDIAPNKQGPRLSGTDFPVTATSSATGEVRVSWSANWDRDNETLTYEVYRTDQSGTPVLARTVTEPYFERNTFGVTDTGLTPGSAQQYRVVARDPFGNAAASAWVPVTVATTGTTSAYAATVRADEPIAWWRMGTGAGTGLDEAAGLDAGRPQAGVVEGTVAGAIAGDTDTASVFDGTSSGYATSTVAGNAPDAFTVEAWVRSSSNRGGKVVGFGNRVTGTSTSGNADRHLYLDNSGRVFFGMSAGSSRTVNSAASITNNQWHHVVGTYASGTLRLYVDGVQVAQRTDVPYEASYWGYWRIGGDRLTGWSNRPTSDYLAGQLDEVAVYGSALTAQQVAAHHTAGTTGVRPANQDPVAALTADVTGLRVDVDGTTSHDADGSVRDYAWSFGDGATATGPTATHTYTATGTYTIALTVTDDRGGSATATREVTVTAPPNQAPTAAFTATASGLWATVDASGSADADGTLTSYAWDFGDGTTGAGRSTAHEFAAAGTYTVTLTVTDDDGATASTSREVAVTVPPPVTEYASDAFARTVASGWGSTTSGAPWTVSTTTGHSVSGGVGVQSVGRAGGTLTATLGSVSTTDVDVQVSVSVDKAQTGGGTYVSLFGRRVGSTDYQGRLRYLATGGVTVAAMRGGTALGSATLPGTAAPGDTYQLRVQVTGTDPTTVRVKAWRSGTAEPTTWQVERTDSTAGLQVPGTVGVSTYVSGSTTNAPIAVRFDDLLARPTVVAPPNAAPTAAFTSTTDGLTAAVDGSGSTDADGTVTSWAWSFGDGATGTGATASHGYAAAGTYPVTLTVTDDDGATATVTHDVTVTAPPVNQAPAAAFTDVVTNLSAVLDGSSSTDPDGSVASWAWDLGDGTSATGASVTHDYAAAGTYPVTLTVTDDDGAQASVTRGVTVTAPAAADVARDTFGRLVDGGWGTAEAGGAWTVTGATTSYVVADGRGAHVVPRAGATLSSVLADVASTRTDTQVTVSLDKAQTGGGTYVSVVGRRVGTVEYSARLRFLATGAVVLGAMQGGTALSQVTVPGLTYAAGDQLRVRLQVVGTSPTTVQAKVWRAGQAEPTAWQVAATDSTAALQAPGSLALVTYLSGSSTNAPMTVSFDDLSTVAVP